MVEEAEEEEGGKRRRITPSEVQLDRGALCNAPMRADGSEGRSLASGRHLQIPHRQHHRDWVGRLNDLWWYLGQQK